MKRINSLFAGLLLAGLLSVSVGIAGEVDVARRLLDSKKDAIVLVEVVLKVKLSARGRSQEREQKLEVNGTVITEDGLVLISNGSIDPSSNYRRFGVKADISTTSVKIVLADGTEHEARIALTDKDLDMAFVRPKAKMTLPFVELKKSEAPGLLDSLISITRLDRKSNREPGVAVSEVMSIIRKPRVRYLSSGNVFPACPVFDANGTVLGIALHRSGSAGLAVLPCEDILEIVRQVPAIDAVETPATGVNGDEADKGEKTDPVDDEDPIEGM